MSLKSNPSSPADFHPTQTANPTGSALLTHIARPPQPSLMAATQLGRQERNTSLANLEKDRANLTRQPDPLTRKFPVTMSFFVVQYRAIMLGDIPAKDVVKVTRLRTTTPILLGLNDWFPNEQALLQWLFQNLHVRTSDLGDKGVEHWRIATTVDVGTQNRRGGWETPNWDEHNAVQLLLYKEMVHEADGKEKDPRRIPLIHGFSAKSARRVLGVFVVHEHRLPEEEEAPNNIYGQPSMPQTHGQQQPVPALPPAPALAPALALHPSAGPRNPRTPSPCDSDNETLFVAQGSSPCAPRSNAQPSSRVKSLKPRSILSSFATHGGRAASTVPSSVDLPSIALSSLALSRSSAPNTAMGYQNQQEQAVDDPWIHSPDQDEFFQRTPNGGGSPFVQPADLEAEAVGGPDVGHKEIGEASGTVFVEEDVRDEVVALVHRKRKRPSPRTACADGKPKLKKPKKAGQSKKTAPPGRPQQPANAGTRQSERIQARA